VARGRCHSDEAISGVESAQESRAKGRRRRWPIQEAGLCAGVWVWVALVVVVVVVLVLLVPLLVVLVVPCPAQPLHLLPSLSSTELDNTVAPAEAAEHVRSIQG
jgi:uncharacterized membrane protein YjgN (DUF898 family)